MSDCSCSPLPTPSCGQVTQPSGECNSIRMFFGAEPINGNGIPGQLNRLYYHDTINSDAIQKGFKISNYSTKPLQDAGILPQQFATFTLTEKELLSTSSFDSWVIYAADSAAFDGPNADRPFGYLCMYHLDIDMDKFKTEAARMWVSIQNGDAGVFLSSLYRVIFGPPKNTSIRYEDSKTNNCNDIKEGIANEQLMICYNWIKTIADTYYGKQFLVKVAGPQQNNSVFPGVCIKDEDGNNPTFDITNNKAFYIDGDGSSQGYYTSDEIADGGFPKQCSKNILGLTKIDWVQNSDGKISSFVKIGKLSSTNYVSCVPLRDRKLYRKFYDHEEKCVYWSIDLAKLDPNNYYIETSDNEDILYVRCEVENKFYVDANGTWVNIILSEKVPLAPADINPILAVRDFIYLLTIAAQQKLYRFLDQFKESVSSKPLAGTRSSISQLNLATALRPCLIPEGAVIPFKSNVYRYGPYYYVSNPDDGGGVDLVIEENIAPWNFIKPGDSSFPDDYPYCAMDKFGKELAKFTTKGLQKLEKGRVTAVGLPCYSIGDSANTTGYDPTKEVGPTLLTDISVEYGSGGFNTTYNFSTYSPRLGKSEKYLREAWSQNLERTKYINSYLRSEREKVNNIKKDYTKQLLDKNYFFSPHIPKHKSSTPNRIVFSGYYISDENDIAEPSSYSFDYNTPTDLECSEPSGNIPSAPLEPSVSDIRRYTFAESDKGYTIEHLQKSYFQLAGMSFDGFYLPVSLRGVNSDPTVKEIIDLNINTNWKNEARLPRFAMRCVENNGDVQFKEWDNDDELDIKSDAGYPIVSKSRDEIPPFKFIGNSSSNCYSLPIHQKYLNPYVSESILETWAPYERTNDSQTGFVISSIVFGQDFTDYQIAHTNNNDADNDIGLSVNKTDEAIRQKYKNFRVPSLRGPLVLQGWGYDTSGKPIPNASDNYINAEYGQFKKDGLKDKFLKDWLQNPKTWPVGPVDLRFDRERGVWTCPSPNKIVVARLKENLCPNGVAKAQLLNPKADNINFYEKYHISGPQGENIKLSMERTEISVYDFLGENIKKCSKVYVYFDDNRYIVLRSEPPETIVRFRHIKLCENSSEEPQNYYGVDSWGAYAGYGDKYYNYHTYGIRIDCDGNAIDINGQLADPGITFDLTFIKNNAENWLIKLQDNAGKFGPSFGKFIDNEQWKNEASTGYASLINTNDDVQCEDSSIDQCYLGDAAECQLDSEIEKKIFSYDILFIESYARFVECELTQDLYIPEEEVSQYQDDEYKTQHPNGNASANISEFYGDSPNGREPKFLKEGGQSIPFRVFDPFIDAREDVNPFIKLKYGDRVLAVFNEKLKKYIIWQSIRKEDKVVKFALTNDKELTDIAATGVLVDQWSRPIDKKGNLITNQVDFSGNFITIRDPFFSRTQFAPVPNGTIGPGQTAFGPALGSSVLEDHYNGITLGNLGGMSGSQYEEEIPPFIGFALQRSLKNEEDEEITVYEMFSLEHYARYIYGKICTKTASFNLQDSPFGCGGGNNNYYLGTVHPTGGFRDGLKPLARQTANLPRGNIVIFHALDNDLKPAIAGDLIMNAADSSYNNIDGCEFIALLDSCASSTKNLIYNIIETTRFALEGKITLKSQYDVADKLNEAGFALDDDLDKMETVWYQGFMWDRIKSQTNFELVEVFNREEWINKGLFITGSVITVYLSGINNDGDPEYSVDNGGTIARVVQRYVSNDDPGLFGLPDGIPADDRKVNDSDDFMHGLDPSVIDNDNKPKIDMSDDQQWMTYDQGIITGLWDETLDDNGEVKNCKYKIIYAQEAPVIITGKAESEFTPEDIGAVVRIVTTGAYASCQGIDRDPMEEVLQNVENPMGYGASPEDWVTIQRVFLGVASPQKANYKYIVIGTGNPPGDLK